METDAYGMGIMLSNNCSYFVQELDMRRNERLLLIDDRKQ
jgi:hypothetical protein